MDENHQDQTESKLTATEDKSTPPPLSTKDHKRPDRPQNNRMGAIIKWLGFFGYDQETKEYTPDGQLAKITKEHQPGKTLWDWLQLIGVLLIPLVIFLATMRFNQQQADIANHQRDADQQRALDQQRAAILQTYIDNIQDLLLNHNLLNSKPDDAVAILARARTLTALEGLDPVRKGLLVQFIYEARLIGFGESKGIPPITIKLHGQIIDLRNANLRGVALRGAILDGAHLLGADLSGANLRNAFLPNASLSGAELSGAELNSATLVSADIICADLRGADLKGAILIGAHLSCSAFIGADLSHANLSLADLSDAGLSGANLRLAELRNANLSGVNLSGAQNLTQQQLDQVYSCKNAILPPGLTCHHNQ